MCSFSNPRGRSFRVWLGRTSSFWLVAALLFYKVVLHREPTWHRRQRWVRQRARQFLRGIRSVHLAGGARRRGRRALRVLAAHHTWNPAEQTVQVLHLWNTMEWQCKKCQTRQLISKENCSKCGQHWSKVWHQRQRVRARSHSKPKPAPQEGKEGKQDEDLAIFSTRTPWVATTPNSRINTVTTTAPSPSAVETAKTVEEGVALPPEPVLPPPPSVDQTKLLEQLRGLRQSMGSLPDELEQKLRDLEAANGASEAKLSHGHLNKMVKVEKQVSGLSDKIRKLDQDWQTFVSQVDERFRKHKGMFLETRAQLVLARKQKIEELAAIKEEITRASQSLLSTASPAEVEVLDVEDQALMESLQQAAVPLAFMDEYPDMEMEEEDPTGPPSEGRPTIAPFRRGGSVTSPSKVANVHLKQKTEKPTKTDGKTG